MTSAGLQARAEPRSELFYGLRLVAGGLVFAVYPESAPCRVLQYKPRDRLLAVKHSASETYRPIILRTSFFSRSIRWPESPGYQPCATRNIARSGRAGPSASRRWSALQQDTWRRSSSSGERRQASEEVIVEPRRYEVFVESLPGVGASPYLLAVGSNQVSLVRGHPVEAATARDDVPRRRPVVDEESVVAVSARKG